jgi:chemotaxis protein CheD
MSYMAEGSEPTFSPNLYFDSSFDIEAAKILPGEYYVTKRDMVLVTVLGSCVAACIRDKVSGIGGMNHFMLPDGNRDSSDPTNASARYGTYAMEMMINQLLKIGARRHNLEAKIFGGGSVIRGLVTVNVGARNAEFAQQYLHTEGITVVSEDLLDDCSRKVYFFPNSGRVLVKKLRTLHNETIVAREQAYRDRLKAVDIQGDIELF